jgi:hypothetical protein
MIAKEIAGVTATQTNTFVFSFAKYFGPDRPSSSGDSWAARKWKI